MIYPVCLTDRVYDELDAPFEWWSKHRSHEQAVRWYNGFLAKLQSLESMPERHPLARENDRFPYDLREAHYGLGPRPSHRALFTIRPDMVLVLTVRHVAQLDVTPDDL